MKKYIAFLLLTFNITLQAQTQDRFIGNWAANGGNMLIEIYTQDSMYYAKIKNPQNHETDNQMVLIQMAKKSDMVLYGGTYYDVELQSEYEAKLKLIDNNTIRLKVLNGLFNSTIFWHRVDADWKQKTNAITVLQH